MFEAQMGDTVTVHYTLTFSDGRVFDSSRQKDPLTFELGQDVFIPGLEKTVLGMKIGENRTRTLMPEDTFGLEDPQLIQTLPKTAVPAGVDCQVGKRIEITLPEAKPLVVRVTAADEDTITIDANPEQTGKKMQLSVQLLDLH